MSFVETLYCPFNRKHMAGTPLTITMTLTGELVPWAIVVHVRRSREDCNAHCAGIAPLAVMENAAGKPFNQICLIARETVAGTV